MKSIPMSELRELIKPIDSELVSKIDLYDVFYSNDDGNTYMKVTYIASLPKNKAIILDITSNPLKVSMTTLFCINKGTLDEYMKSNSCSNCICNLDNLCPYGRDGNSIDYPCLAYDSVESVYNLLNFIEREVEELPEGQFKTIDDGVLTNLMVSLWLANNQGLIYNSSTGKVSNTFIYPISEANKPVDSSIRVVSSDALIKYATKTKELPTDKKDIIDAMTIDNSVIIENLNEIINLRNSISKNINELEVVSYVN